MIIGHRKRAAGLIATRPLSAADISKGRSAPQTLGPPNAERVRIKGLSRTTPAARHALSLSARQGSYLATKFVDVPQLAARNATRRQADMFTLCIRTDIGGEFTEIC
ncbi:exported protein of unknown function [Candidatus Filomicrobium marinum]|uniref:Uncharacterized protein n=1 Tax=Candidatus Filomicrobium marinum TaxID=1608628 RepID=A0A0D6JKM5_9HYPH|nr:exported protein of unknown function [Candidatus Filomicrobium marinum]CPR22519.1 exported protein of unknown function [Candidatus Filomicrobium marinum]